MSQALPRRRLGQGPLQVTTLGFGCAPLGEHKVLVPEASVQSALAAAHDAGVRYFDTAPFYGYGLAELRLGYFVREQAIAECILSSKVGRWLRPRTATDTAARPFKGGLQFEPVFDYSLEGTMRSHEQTLLRLGLPRIDLLLVHDIDRWTWGDRFVEVLETAVGGALSALRQLKKRGEVDAIGIGVNDAESALDLLERCELDCIMLAGEYTLLDQPALDRLLPECVRRGTSLLAAAPFASGILATGARAGANYRYRPASEEILARVRRVERVCADHGVPLAAAALQFPLGHSAVASVVAGAVSAPEVQENGRLMRYRIPREFWEELKRQRLLAAAAPVPD